MFHGTKCDILFETFTIMQKNTAVVTFNHTFVKCTKSCVRLHVHLPYNIQDSIFLTIHKNTQVHFFAQFSYNANMCNTIYTRQAHAMIGSVKHWILV